MISTERRHQYALFLFLSHSTLSLTPYYIVFDIDNVVKYSTNRRKVKTTRAGLLKGLSCHPIPSSTLFHEISSY